MRRIAALSLDRLPKEILEPLQETACEYFVYRNSVVDNYVNGAVLPLEQAVRYDCLCLDFESFWALRLARRSNKWLVFSQEYDFPPHLNQNVIKFFLKENPPITFDKNIKEIMGVPVQYEMA